MNLPNWLINFFREEFNGAQVAVLNDNWWKYTSISLNNSTREQLMTEAKIILSMVLQAKN